MGANGTYDVKVTATNWFGETAASAAATGSSLAGQVIDVTIVPSLGAMNYNIYVSTQRDELLPGRDRCGGTKYTLQGTPPSGGTARPAADSGTGKSHPHRGDHPHPDGRLRERRRVPDVPGHVAGRVLSTRRSAPTCLQRDLHGAGEPVAAGHQLPRRVQGRPGRADLLGHRHRQPVHGRHQPGAGHQLRAVHLSSRSGTSLSARPFSQFQNPLTKSLLKLVVHPWYTQGNASCSPTSSPRRGPTWRTPGK